MVTNWVLLRGLMRERRHWGDFPQQLQQALPEARLHALDFAGNGVHHAMRSAVEVDGMLEFCRAQLQAQAVAPPYRLLALSLGAMVAVRWCQRYPHEVEGGVLLNTSMRPFSRFYRRLRWRNYPALVAALVRGVAWRERLILRLTSRDGAARPGLHEQWVQFQRQCPVAPANALRQLWAAARFRAAPEAPMVPLLVLAGGGDRLVDPACSRSLASRWRLPCRQHPSAGHDLPLDEPGWTVGEVAQWSAQLDRHRADAGAPRTGDLPE